MTGRLTTSTMNTKAISLITWLSLTLAAFGDFVEITDWDLTKFKEDGALVASATAVAHLGENVTWTSSTGIPVWQFHNANAYHSCSFHDAIEVLGGVYETWPEGIGRKQIRTIKGIKYFASESGCEDGEKMAVIVKQKKFRKKNNNMCTGGIEIRDDDIPDFDKSLDVRESKLQGKKQCLKLCRNTRKCFGLEWSKAQRFPGMAGRPEQACTMFSNFPGQKGGKGDYRKVSCFVVVKNNTLKTQKSSSEVPPDISSMPSTSPTGYYGDIMFTETAPPFVVKPATETAPPSKSPTAVTTTQTAPPSKSPTAVTMAPSLKTTNPPTTSSPTEVAQTAPPFVSPTAVLTMAPSLKTTNPPATSSPTGYYGNYMYTQTLPPEPTKIPSSFSYTKPPRPPTKAPTTTASNYYGYYNDDYLMFTQTVPPLITKTNAPTGYYDDDVMFTAAFKPPQNAKFTKPPSLYSTTRAPKQVDASPTKSPKAKTKAPTTSSPTDIKFQLFSIMPKTKAPKSMKTKSPKDAAVTLGPGETYSPTTSVPSKAPKDASVTLGPGETYSPTKDPKGRRRVRSFNAPSIKASNKTPSLVSSLL